MSRFRSVRLLLVATVFLALGSAFLWLLGADRYAMYLSKRLWPLMLVGALGALMLSAGLLLSGAMRRKEDESRKDLLTAGILLLPLLYLFVHEGDSLDSHAFRSRSVSMVETLSTPPSASQDGDTIRLDLYRLLRDYSEIAGRPVVVEGALDGSGERPVLFRFLIVCCVNDAVPKGIFLNASGLDSLPDDSWIVVRGVADTVMIGGDVYPCIGGGVVSVTPPPPSPYMYP